MSSEALTWAKSVTAGSAQKKSLLLTLADFAGTGHELWPGQKKLAEISEQGERTVRRQLAEFEKSGLICRSARFRPDRRGRTSDYIYLHVPYRPIRRVDMPMRCAGCDRDLTTGQIGRLDDGDDDEPTNRPITTRPTGQSRHDQPANHDTTNRPPVAGEEPPEKPPDEPRGNHAPLSGARGTDEPQRQADVERVAKAISRATDDAPVSRSLRERIGKLLDSHDVDELVGLIEHETSWLGLKPPLMVEFLEQHAGQRSTSSSAAASPSPPSDVDYECADCGSSYEACECAAPSGVRPVAVGGP